ncbi:unnamed protein product [Adineta ricciae]|uniref:Uncharacterized protein n=1 Tax=Adineta ricciae TaxID=249248 RepID=A0A815N8Y6_ADIRI|nr:unnamed protein product [Adineta ricciae]CAF1433897.1 unnamed protein product [Adineta ricciae]
MFGRIQSFQIVKLLTSVCFILMIYKYLNEYPNPDFTDSSYINLTFNALKHAKHEEMNFKTQYQLTGIIVSSQHSPNIKPLLHYYLETKLFQEIIIWNDDPQKNLTLNSLLNKNTSSIRIHIINSNKTLRDQSKYRACALAQTLVCFYVDVEWNIKSYIRSLISSFRSDPNVLHTTSDLSMFYKNMFKTYFDESIDLHTGFAVMNRGSVFLREHAQRHLQFLEIHFKDHPEFWLFSDVYFPIWFNDIPTQLIVNVQSLPITENQRKADIYPIRKITELQQTSSILALRQLESSLRLNERKTNGTFPRHQQRRFPYLIKTSSPTDEFILFSNILAFDISTQHTRRGNEFKSNDSMDSNVTKAIDGDETTCWNPRRFVNKGDFFAFDFHSIETNIILLLIVNQSENFRNYLDIHVSFDGQWWISSPLLSQQIKSEKFIDNFHRLIIDSKHFPLQLRSFRYISFNATRYLSESFSLCEVKLLK